MRPGYGLLDTSAIIATDTGRRVDPESMPIDVSISVITFAEIETGVYAARDTETRARRMATLDWISEFELLPVDDDAAREWARLRYRLAEARRRVNINDLWIASIAIAHGLPVVTQHDDFDMLLDLGGPDVIRV
jgi:predicted nucleic acid-binding protein